jgi:hypothetical protein
MNNTNGLREPYREATQNRAEGEHTRREGKRERNTRKRYRNPSLPASKETTNEGCIAVGMCCLCVEVERLLQASKWHRHVTCINLSEQHLRADCDIFLFVICASSAKRHGAAWVTTSAEVEAKPMKRPISRRTAAAPRRSGEAWGSSSAAPRPAIGRSAATLATRLGDQRRHGGPLPDTTRDTGKPKAVQTLTARTLQGSAV